MQICQSCILPSVQNGDGTGTPVGLLGMICSWYLFGLVGGYSFAVLTL
jgi:hypothetical protein